MLKTHVSDEEVGEQVVILNTAVQLHQEEAERKHTQLKMKTFKSFFLNVSRYNELVSLK